MLTSPLRSLSFFYKLSSVSHLTNSSESVRCTADRHGWHDQLGLSGCRPRKPSVKPEPINTRILLLFSNGLTGPCLSISNIQLLGIESNMSSGLGTDLCMKGSSVWPQKRWLPLHNLLSSSTRMCLSALVTCDCHRRTSMNRLMHLCTVRD